MLCACKLCNLTSIFDDRQACHTMQTLKECWCGKRLMMAYSSMQGLYNDCIKPLILINVDLRGSFNNFISECVKCNRSAAALSRARMFVLLSLLSIGLFLAGFAAAVPQTNLPTGTSCNNDAPYTLGVDQCSSATTEAQCQYTSVYRWLTVLGDLAAPA